MRIKPSSRLLAVVTMATAVLTIGSTMVSLALFTESESVPATFSSGTVVLDDVKIDALALSVSGMMPGDSITDDVVVENDGSAQLRYAVSATSTNTDAIGLYDVLTLTVKTADVDATVPCDAFDGTQLFSGTLGASTTVFGSSSAGAQAGDRTLNAAATETLCFRVSLPSGTANAYQGASTTTTFAFDAEQTANNP